MKKSFKKALIMMLSVIMVFTYMAMPVYASGSEPYAEGERAEATLEGVLAEIDALSNDPRDFTAADRDKVEAINADYEALSAEDQATVDHTFDHPSGDGQSYGRILEAALWAVRSFDTDTSTTLADGTYTTSTDPAVSSESNKGKSDSSRTRNWWVESVAVENGQATAYIYVTSGAATGSKLTSYPSVWTGGQTIDRNSDNNYPIPVDLNGTTYFGGISSSMPRPIMYTLSTTIAEPANVQPIQLTIVNNTGMFKAVTASALVNEDGSAALTMALSGTGYHYLYKGTYEQAVANGDKTENWIAGYENADGKWEFVIPVAADELGKDVPVVAVSQSYYDKYLNGQNSIDRAFYPRQLNLDLEQATLTTDDYKATKEIAVTNNIKMFKPGETAALDCVGGPNSNGYKADLVLPMLSDSMSEVFVGDYAEAAAATETIAFDSEAMTFTIPVKWVETFGQPETLVNLANGEAFHICFKSKNNSTWYERKATLSEEAKTLVFDPSNADYTAVTAAQEAAAAIDRDKYTEESLAVMDAAVAAVVTGKFESQQAEVDAMAKAINDAIDALVEKSVEPVVVDVEITANSYEGIYDGKSHAAEGFVGETEQGTPVTSEGKTYYVTGLTSKAEGKNVSDSTESIPVTGTAVVKDADGNDATAQFNVKVIGGHLTISAKDVTLASGNAEKEYDGTALTNADVEGKNENGLTVETGWAEGEGAAYTFTGSQTEPGTSTNSFTYALKDGTLAENYNISKTEGQLTVKAKETKDVVRIFGSNRYETSLKVADELLAMLGTEKFETVILASGKNYPDALAGSYLSCTFNSPILLVDDNKAHIDAVQSYIKENVAEGGTIYMLGGTAVVPDAAAAGLDAYKAVRLGGANRYLTDLRILEEGLKADTGANEILVSTGKDFADSLSVASVGKPILLVGPALTADQKDFLGKLEGEYTFTAVGGTGAVSEAVMKELEAYGKTDRVGGKNRYETSVEVAKKYFKSAESGVLAYARNYPDGLCGGAIAYKLNAPLIITNDSAIATAAAYAEEQGVKYGAVLGGTTLISDASVKAFFQMGEDDEIIVR